MRNALTYLGCAVALALASAFIAHLRLSDIPDPSTTEVPARPQLGAPSPPNVSYEIYGTQGAPVTLSYLDFDGTPQTVTAVVPWQKSVQPQAPTMAAALLAQTSADNLSCRITVNGRLRAEHSSNAVAATVSCSVDVA
ncbi:MmpS family transport accessory protein [Mycobacteroides abscessus]|uniref:MmpS family transport accessory protein n=1 Tax=Mycobacteroides abscessus TaxID=36809 RepID=UPI0003706DBE